MNKITLLFISLCFSTLVNAKLIKVSNEGVLLADDAKQWSCVLDDKSQLMWEVKVSKKGLQDAQSTYTWFDGNSGVEGGEYSRNCQWGKGCNTQAFIQALNKGSLCQSSNWHLPSESELTALLVYNDDNPLINLKYFPNTQSQPYWTSMSHTHDDSVAIDVPFFYGGTNGSDKSFDSYIRAVSNAK
ncbi:MAG: DUF1566 domain-containing protein [Candidatus Ruthia sp.]|nr:DUF1566 domain-containing protein [Candidatus Ruthturnera sp.]